MLCLKLNWVGVVGFGGVDLYQYKKAVEMASSTAAATGWYRGRVKAVPSGDSLVIMALTANKAGPPPERTITLSSLMAPKLVKQITSLSVPSTHVFLVSCFRSIVVNSWSFSSFKECAVMYYDFVLAQFSALVMDLPGCWRSFGGWLLLLCFVLLGS